MEKLTNQVDLDSGIAVIKFYATWCQPCKKMTPIIEKLAEEFKIAKFYEADVDEDTDLVHKFDIKSVPSVVFLENGKIFSKVIGVSLITPLRSILREMIKN